MKLFFKCIFISTLSMTLCLPSLAISTELPSFETDKLSSITMIATASNTLKLKTTYNKMTADMTLALSAAQTYTKAEVFSTGAFKNIANDLKLLVSKISEGKQTEAICDLLQSYKDAKAVLEKKIILQKAAAAAFNSAAVAAHKMKINESPIHPGAEDGVLSKSGPANYAACTKKILFAINLDQGILNSCGRIGAMELKNKSEIAKASMIAFLKVREKVEESLTNESETKSKRQKAESDISNLEQTQMRLQIDPEHVSCATTLADIKTTCSIFTNKLTSNQAYFRKPAENKNNNKNKESSANKESSPNKDSVLFELGDNSTEIIKILAPQLAAEADKYMFTPAKRTTLWQLVKGRADEVVVATQAEIAKVDANILKTKKMLHMQVENHSIFENLFNIIISKVYAETNSANLSSASGFEDLSPSLRDLALQITDFADELMDSNSFSARTQNQATKIAGHDPAISKLLKPALGVQEVQNQKDLLKKFNNITASVLKKKNTTPAAFFASYGKSLSSKTDAVINPAKSALKKVDSVSLINTKPVMAGKTIETAKGEVFANVNGEDHRFEKNYKLNDISQNKDDSIFTVISNRYFKSAFSKLSVP